MDMTNHLYCMILRPASKATLPSDVVWDYIEAPAMYGLANRPDLPTSKHRYGVIRLDRALTDYEMEHFDIKEFDR
jgi:hypothetical protein